MKTVIFAVAALLCATMQIKAAETADKAWAETYPAIEKQIKVPEFRNKEYKLLDFGKRSNTEGYLYTELINRVIDRCSSEGGGKVVIPAGT